MWSLKTRLENAHGLRQAHSFKQQIEPVFNVLACLFYRRDIFFFQEEIFSIFYAKDQLIFYLENFVRRANKFYHLKDRFYKLIALSPQQAAAVLRRMKSFTPSLESFASPLLNLCQYTC